MVVNKQGERLVNGCQQTSREVKMEPIRKDMELLSNSMATYAHIKANPESFALYFMMGVCFGLLLALCLLVTGITCRTRRTNKPSPSPERRQLRESSEEEEDEESVDVEEGEESEIPKVTVAPMSDRSSQSNGTLRSVNVFASAEELERARRLEDRERIVREIWRNGQPDILTTGTGTIGRIHYH
ncbi:protein eva-1 homolog B-like [Salvelinus fontinalis]|uniref:protein eva-1 homolog B-like n=1 Tax=Salvelinus fontinalis TaxID=8038 RepID=UPI0024855FF0|nr:protein eva-1 homolog B-like [Salvelinus fontinalis]